MMIITKGLSMYKAKAVLVMLLCMTGLSGCMLLPPEEEVLPPPFG